jgi:hypothetical protein
MTIIQLQNKDIPRIRQMLSDKQDNICPVCNSIMENPVLDHDHSRYNGGTGLCRGVLCRKCNVYLGIVERFRIKSGLKEFNLIDLLEGIIEYLKQPQTNYIHPSEQKIKKKKKLGKRQYMDTTNDFFKEYDKKFRFKDYNETVDNIRKTTKYNYFTEYIVESYKENQSMNKTATQCNSTFGTVKNIINKLPDDIKKQYNVKIRDKGGRVWSQLTDDDVRYIRSHKFMNIIKYNELAKELTNKKGEEITAKDVERCYTKKTHKDIK